MSRFGELLGGKKATPAPAPAPEPTPAPEPVVEEVATEDEVVVDFDDVGLVFVGLGRFWVLVFKKAVCRLIT